MIAPRVARTLIAVVLLIAITLAAVLFVQVNGSSQTIGDTFDNWVPLASVVALVAAIIVIVVGRYVRH